MVVSKHCTLLVLNSKQPIDGNCKKPVQFELDDKSLHTKNDPERRRSVSLYIILSESKIFRLILSYSCRFAVYGIDLV